MHIHRTNKIYTGDILVFLTGQDDIHKFIESASTIGLNRSDTLILPLYSGLSLDKQLEVFKPAPGNKRKIIVSTNIAEASITVDNIAYVVDSSYMKMKFYNQKIDAEALYIIPASKFSLDQSSGFVTLYRFL